MAYLKRYKQISNRIFTKCWSTGSKIGGNHSLVSEDYTIHLRYVECPDYACRIIIAWQICGSYVYILYSVQMTRDLILTQSSAQGKYDEYYKERKNCGGKMARYKESSPDYGHWISLDESLAENVRITKAESINWWISSWECPDYGCWISLDESLAENVRITAAESHLMIL